MERAVSRGRRADGEEKIRRATSRGRLGGLGCIVGEPRIAQSSQFFWLSCASGILYYAEL